MSEDKTEEISETPTHHQAVDVFTHSKTGFPGAWSEEEISFLLDTWEDILKRPRSRRFSVSKKLVNRLAKDERFKNVTKDDVVRQMKTLRTEYSTYLGLNTVGIETVKPDYVDQLEQIFSKFPKFLKQDKPRQRRNTEPTRQSDGVSEDSDHPRSVSVSYGDRDRDQKEFSFPRSEEGTNAGRRPRFQRMNIPKLIKTMTTQQINLMEQVQKLFTSLEASNEKSAKLLEDLVNLQKSNSIDQKSEIIASMA